MYLKKGPWSLRLIMLTLYAAVFVSIGVIVSGRLPPLTSVGRPSWRYDNELQWPGRACKEGGPRQSPIDIRTAHVVMDHDRRFIKHGALRYTGYDDVRMAAINNGHTIQLTTADKKALPTLTGGPLHHVYVLEQLHFHWISEHAIDGFKYPLEIHFVHIRSNLSVPQALQRRDGLAILAVFCNVLPDTDLDVEDEHSPLGQVLKHLPRLRHRGNRVSGLELNLTRLLPNDPQKYLTYAGSLTSPECNEAVTWIIMEHPLYIADNQYKRLLQTTAGRHNFRSLQPLELAVYRPVDVHFNTPLLLALLGDTLDILTGFFRNVTKMLEQSKDAV